MSHVLQAQDVTWQCGTCRQMHVVFAGHFAFLCTGKLAQPWWVVDGLSVGHLQRKSLLSHDLLVFVTYFSEWHQCKLTLIVWWTGFKRTRQSCHHRKQSLPTCKGFMSDNNLTVFSVNAGEFKEETPNEPGPRLCLISTNKRTCVLSSLMQSHTTHVY